MKKISPAVLILILVFCSLNLSAVKAEPPAQEASFYEKLKNLAVQCRLCPRECVIVSGKRGYCGVRENKSGKLYALSYAKPVAIHSDPIEKKPLFHFLPGTSAFSVATAGCNLKCKFCQNWEISQARTEDLRYEYIEPAELVQKARDSRSLTIAYTYSEPTIFYEYMLETAKAARLGQLKNVMHSNGYINEEPLRELAKYLDAANIDLKGFSDEYYTRLSQGSLAPVLRSLKILKESGVHLEITNLILPGYNDDLATITKMCLWIKDNLGADTPIHFSRFYPMYKLIALIPTPVETLEKAANTARDCGLKYVYIGNIPGHAAENTYCPKCLKAVIERSGYMVSRINLQKGRCKSCQQKIEGIWE
jgi:pyruvate formate lyase activating enzyme